ncbi:polyketide cyclase / dehydrase and lipid transport [Pseudonocardia endophytica]|nr:polyketide cyclase / dehydrase and lipid transport [Pseudonocardia endophytica]
MPAIDVVDETFLAVPRERVATVFADPAAWSRFWPDLDVELMTDRGAQGVRWTVVGERVGTMEVWLEQVLDGTVLHYFLRVDPAGRDRRRTRAEIRRDARADRDEGRRRQRDAKRIAFALKRDLEGGRPAGEPPEHREKRQRNENRHG